MDGERIEQIGRIVYAVSALAPGGNAIMFTVTIFGVLLGAITSLVGSFVTNKTKKAQLAQAQVAIDAATNALAKAVPQAQQAVKQTQLDAQIIAGHVMAVREAAQDVAKHAETIGRTVQEAQAQAQATPATPTVQGP